jgi:hypothetical protein
MFKSSSSLVKLVYLELLRYSIFSSSDIRGNSSVWSLNINNPERGHDKKNNLNDAKDEVSIYKIKIILFKFVVRLV